MAALTRKFKKIFAKDSANNGVFGSAAALAPATSTNPETIESLAAFLTGWEDATEGGLKLPTLEDMQGLKYDTDYHLAYIYQTGMQVYDSQTTYYTNDLVRKDATTEIWKSLVDNNTGNALVAGSNWILTGNLANIPTSPIVTASTATKGIALLTSPITIANNASDANNDIDFSAGVFQFSDGSGQAAASAITKRLDASWTAGTNQGGLDTGSKANSTWYHCYAIYNPTTLVSDFLFSTGAITPTLLPSGYTKFKRLGSIKTDGSGNIRGFFQNRNYFFLKTPVLEFSGSSTTTAALLALNTPLGIKTIAIVSSTCGTTPGSTKILRIFSPDATDATPDASNTNGGYIQTSGSTTDVYLGSGNILVPTNTSSQVYHRASVSTTITINTQGWIDNGIL
jgi:hypothetical protein